MPALTDNIILVAEGETTPATETGTEAAPQDAHAADAGTEAHAASTEHKEVFPPFDPVHFGGQLLWLALAFAALYLLMSRVALPRIGGIIETRRSRIDGDLREAERLRQETEKAAAAYEAALAEARRNAHAIAEETRAGIKADIDNRRADVEAQLQKRVADAEARIRSEQDKAMANVGSIAAETAQALVARIAGSVSADEAKKAVAAVSKE